MVFDCCVVIDNHSGYNYFCKLISDKFEVNIFFHHGRLIIVLSLFKYLLFLRELQCYRHQLSVLY